MIKKLVSTFIMPLCCLTFLLKTPLTFASPVANIAICSQNINNKNINKLAKQLGWVISPNPYNLCGGYYKTLPIIYTPSKLVASQTDNYDIKADHTIYSLKKQTSLKLTGHVTITQIDRELTSDTAYVYQSNGGKVHQVHTLGNVKLRTPDTLLLSKQANFNAITKLITLDHVIYRIVSPTLPNTEQTKIKKVISPKTKQTEWRSYQLNARGEATNAKQINPKLIKMKNATYTTCPPTSNTWQLKASTVTLNSKTGRGQTINTRLYIKGIPIFYFPYFNFPIDKHRQSGFLTPAYNSSSRSGPSIAIPYYFNILPNYDLTITPDIIFKRGVLWNTLFRYLPASNTNGNLKIGFIDADREFKRFRQNAKTEQAWIKKPTYNRLNNASNNRSAISWINSTKLTSNWSTNIDYNYVSDDYYIQDFGDGILDNNKNQLLQQAKLNYNNVHWHFLANIQNYQTLHPVNQDPVANQYARLPQLQLNGYFPNEALGLNYALFSDATHFYKKPYPGTETKSSNFFSPADRFSFRPSIKRPFIFPFGYIIPRFQAQLTKYYIPGKNHPSIAVPISDVKAGLYFDRTMTWMHKTYQQTLEPILYYLYIPYRNQNQLPYFDTTTQAFDYNFMFQNNRFSGFDRIGDTNRVTLGLTSRFIDEVTGNEKAKASIGQIYYFKKRLTTLCFGHDCQPTDADRKMTSPIAAAANYNFNPYWSINGGLTWNTYLAKFNNEKINFQYKPNTKHILNIGYNFVRGGDVLPGTPANSPENDLKQTDISTYWNINRNWSFIGRWNYNLSHEHAQAFFYGFAYESCCWAIRLIASRTYVGLTPHNKHRFDNGFYVQFAFKGLGSIGNSNPNTLLNQTINGYTDTFGIA